MTAELAGKIIMVNVREGESPREAGQTAVVLYNLDSMTITANIDELDIDGIAMGMEVDITQSGAESEPVGHHAEMCIRDRPTPAGTAGTNCAGRQSPSPDRQRRCGARRRACAPPESAGEAP